MSSKESKNADELLDELYELTVAEQERELTEEENKRYLEIYDYCRANDIPIDFGIEI